MTENQKYVVIKQKLNLQFQTAGKIYFKVCTYKVLFIILLLMLCIYLQL